MKVSEPIPFEEDERDYTLCDLDGHFYTEYDGKLYCWECGAYLGTIA